MMNGQVGLELQGVPKGSQKRDAAGKEEDPLPWTLVLGLVSILYFTHIAVKHRATFCLTDTCCYILIIFGDVLIK